MEKKCEKNSWKTKTFLLKDSTALLCYVVLTRHKSYLQIVVSAFFLSFSLVMPGSFFSHFLLSRLLLSLSALCFAGRLAFHRSRSRSRPNHIQFQNIYLCVSFSMKHLSPRRLTDFVWRKRPPNRLTNKHPDEDERKFPRSGSSKNGNRTEREMIRGWERSVLMLRD